MAWFVPHLIVIEQFFLTFFNKICSSECDCIDCHNSEAAIGPNDFRTKVMSDILKRRPDAFQKREKEHDGCSCKKTR
jgi:hypothetical protein